LGLHAGQALPASEMLPAGFDHGRQSAAFSCKFQTQFDW
jgi:hypothetical protein